MIVPPRRRRIAYGRSSNARIQVKEEGAPGTWNLSGRLADLRPMKPGIAQQ
jgi:hypothetical protein